MTPVVISTRDLTKHYPVGGGLFGGADRIVRAVDGVTLDIHERETFALVGESGCGKTTLGRVILRLQDCTSGSVSYRGTDLHGLNDSQLRGLRKKLQIVFQDPYASLNPRMRVQEILAEPLRTHGHGSAAEIRDRCFELLDMVGLRQQFLRYYPHQFSGGQRQRIGIARALANNPEFVVCDEPVSALDVSIQAQVLNLLRDLQDQLKLTYFFITHDFSVVRQFADRVGVMFLGRLVEVAPTEDLFAQPLHPYTMFLIAAVPRANPHLRGQDRPTLTGEIPSPMNLPTGCRFHTRCPFAKPLCRSEDPVLADHGGRSVACHFPLTS
jgi:oligopeptide/dipeptide ABC transporter ATP-binding protein